MRYAALILSPLLVACGNDATAPTVPPELPPSTMGSADEAYRDAARAWNDGDRNGYFGAYADTLECFYDRAGLSRASIEGGPRGSRFRTASSARMILDSLTTVRDDGTEAMLIDEGRVVSQGSERRHRKLIVMRRTADQWRIVVEVSPTQHACWRDLPAGFGAASPERSRDVARALNATCRVVRVEQDCACTGCPPCREVRTPDGAPPVRPGADRREAQVALERYSEGVSCELTPRFGPTGHISRLDGHCMGVGATSWVYEGCP